MCAIKNDVVYFLSMCFFSLESASFKSKFIKQINSSFGSGGMSLAMNDAELAFFLMFLKSSLTKSSSTPYKITKAATVIGQQSCGQVWVMGKDLQVR